MTDAIDSAQVRRRVLLKLATSPSALVPFLAGATLLVISWALDLRSGGAVFAGIVSVLIGAGLFLTRLFAGSDGLEKAVLADMQEEARQAREKELDQLDKDLGKDGDPRTEQILRDLRVLTAALEQDKIWSSGMNLQSGFDLAEGVDQLFRGGVAALRKALELWKTARDIATPDARKPILARRERLIEELRTSVGHLGKILAEVQAMGSSEASDQQLQNVRRELDASLDVAKRVEQRMTRWEKSGYSDAE
jgi:hypothetical protein